MYDLDQTFAVIGPDQRVTPVPVTADLYGNLDRDFAGFRGHSLVSRHAFDQDWPTWEMHPAGDEIVVLMEGEAVFVLDRDGREERIGLTQAGAYVIVPKATWHTAKIAKRAVLLFITPGEGTRNEVRR